MERTHEERRVTYDVKRDKHPLARASATFYPDGTIDVTCGGWSGPLLQAYFDTLAAAISADAPVPFTPTNRDAQ